MLTLATAKAVLMVNAALITLAIALGVGLFVARQCRMLRDARRSVPFLALNHPNLACTCGARLPACACADQHGVRNPRGAGRGRMRRPS